MRGWVHNGMEDTVRVPRCRVAGGGATGVGCTGVCVSDRHAAGAGGGRGRYEDAWQGSHHDACMVVCEDTTRNQCCVKMAGGQGYVGDPPCHKNPEGVRGSDPPRLAHACFQTHLNKAQNVYKGSNPIQPPAA